MAKPNSNQYQLVDIANDEYKEACNEAIQTLEIGATMLLGIKKTKSHVEGVDEAFSYEIAQRMPRTSQINSNDGNILEFMMQGHPSYIRKARRAHTGATIAQLTSQFGISQEMLDQLEIKGNVAFIGWKEPFVTINNEQVYLGVRIVETFEGSDYDFNNLDSQAKRKGADGDFIKGFNPETKKAEYIFSKGRVAGYIMKDNKLEKIGNWEHVLIPEHTNEVTKLSETEAVDTTTGEVKDMLSSI